MPGKKSREVCILINNSGKYYLKPAFSENLRQSAYFPKLKYWLPHPQKKPYIVACVMFFLHAEERGAENWEACPDPHRS